MRRVPLRLIFAAAVAAIVGSSVLYLVADSQLPMLRERAARMFAVRPEFTDVVERLDLQLELAEPPRVAGVATLQLRTPTSGSVWLILNRDLDVLDARDERGDRVEWRVHARIRSDYFKEARALEFELARSTRSLRIEYAGSGADGSAKRDWMGVLLAARDELRMSPQSAFHPQIPLDIDGPRAIAWPLTMRVNVPAGFEAYAPGTSSVRDEPDGARSYEFRSDTPVAPSFFAAPRVRRESRVGESRVVTLLREEHAPLGESIARDAERMLRFYQELWGPTGSQTLGIVEFVGRGNSYNWASPAIVAMETGALANGLADEKLPHEIAHLWWGQAAPARGRGERLLTEGLAELASWRHLASLADGESIDERAARARDEWWTSVHATGVDPACSDVRFGVAGYTELAYEKCPAALWEIQRQMGDAAFDAALRRYAELARSTRSDAHSVELFASAVREVSGGRAVDLAPILTPGHLHAEFADVVFDDTSVAGVLRAAPCPKSSTAPRYERAALTVYTRGGRERAEVRFGERFVVRTTSRPECVALDRGSVPEHVVCEPCVAPGDGWLFADPPDGARELPTGPLTFRLRAGVELAALPRDVTARTRSATTRARRENSSSAVRVVSVALEAGARSVVVEIDETEPGTRHVLALPAGLTTASGAPLPATRVEFFVRSMQGVPPPEIVRTEPADGALVVAADVQCIVIEFSEPMRKGRGFAKRDLDEESARGHEFPPLGESEWRDSRTLVWKFEPPLRPGSRYALPFGDRFRSSAGHRLAPRVVRFETRP